MVWNGILQVRKTLLRVSMIEGEHYTTMAEIFCVDSPSVSWTHFALLNTEDLSRCCVMFSFDHGNSQQRLPDL